MMTRFKIVEGFLNMKIHTRGKNAGGAQTNKNGLPYENLTELKTEYNPYHGS